LRLDLVRGRHRLAWDLVLWNRKPRRCWFERWVGRPIAPRDVYLLDELAPLLKKHKTQAFARGHHARPEDFVFATQEGKPFFQRNAAHALRRAVIRPGLNREGIPPVSWHDLRHTHISP
jgi:integrase